MDAVYAWDQQDIHFHVPDRIDHYSDQAIFYQTSLGARGENSRGAVGGALLPGEALLGGSWGRACASLAGA